MHHSDVDYWRHLQRLQFEENFWDGSFKNNRRVLFFPAQKQEAAWSAVAERDPDAFVDEE